MNLDTLTLVSEQYSDELANYHHLIHICAGTGCTSANSMELLDRLNEVIKSKGLQDVILAKMVGCMGLCAEGPVVNILPDDILYRQVTPEDAEEIIDHLVRNEVLERLRLDTHLPFFTRQQKTALVNSGIVNPESIEDYIAHGGYKALLKVLTQGDRLAALEEIKRSGLRGRGGAGFSTGMKWQFVYEKSNSPKYVICNADEGDPGAFMDRSIIESDPHSVIEGMAIAAYVVGAEKGFIYVRAEYPLAIKRLRKAIREATKHNLLGTGISGTGFNFEIDLRLGAGAFVCGEETALMQSVMGNRGNPMPRPPFPAEKGLWSQPTLINNVETLANVPRIIEKGGDWFASTGVGKSKGTKVFALSGKITHTGLIEVPMGITLREIIEEIGGGVPGGRKLKAVQTGGPSGGCIPAEYLDTQVSYEALNELGAIMGSGGMIVIDDSSSMIELARYFMEFSMDESCGKCIPCRAGTAQIHNLLSLFVEGKATENDLEKLEELCEVVCNTSLCGLGQNAPNPVISTLKYFRNEYIEAIRRNPDAVERMEINHE
ncbi:MAG: NADH-quinone oxidoreductase subunit NuoF [Anaerolineae bacterium]|nr:NADH-quinone oxidoreductase subunit NuoF [Anaerolineae bacterium]